MNERASFAVFVACLLACGCEKQNTWCQTHLNDPECPDSGIDGPATCTTDDQCRAPTAACNTSTMSCVQCTTSKASACSGATPTCGSDDTCRGCEAHAECNSAACLPDGSCGAESAVAYVDASGTDNATCTRATPCTKLTSAVATGRAYVKITGTINEGGTVTIDNHDVTLLATPGATLARTSNGIVLEVKGTSRVAVYDLEISGGSGAQGIGISLPTGNTASVELHRAKVTGNAGGGISATGGTLTISKSTVTGNTGGGISATGGTLTVSQSTISGNTGGGISISGAQFTLQNNIIASNGSGATIYGGIRVDSITTPGIHRIEFNTVTANLGPASIDTGITCGAVITPLVFSNNIVYANIVSGTGQQFGGNANCTATYSDIGPSAVVGTGNINQAPQFANPPQGDYHIAATSPCKDAADPAATLAVDLDGDTRPQGAARDIGADERP